MENFEESVIVLDSFPNVGDETKIIFGDFQVIIKRRNHSDFIINGLFENKSADQCIAEDESLQNLQNETAKVAVQNVDQSASDSYERSNGGEEEDENEEHSQ